MTKKNIKRISKDELMQNHNKHIEQFKKRLEEEERKQKKLLFNIKQNIEEFIKLQIKANEHWTYEDYIYRFYHQSYKVYGLQDFTFKAINLLKKVAPEDTAFNTFFEKISYEGTGQVFKTDHNKSWLEHTRPILEAFFHAKYFIDMAVKYSQEFDEPPQYMPSGWACLLYFYDLR